jgi:hypothetical protein
LAALFDEAKDRFIICRSWEALFAAFLDADEPGRTLAEIRKEDVGQHYWQGRVGRVVALSSRLCGVVLLPEDGPAIEAAPGPDTPQIQPPYRRHQSLDQRGDEAQAASVRSGLFR